MIDFTKALALAEKWLATTDPTDAHLVADELAHALQSLAPDAAEVEALASMRQELLDSDWAYWHDDAAVQWLERALGPASSLEEPK